MKVLVACEFSARVRDAFRKRGHDAYSCDLLPCDGDPIWHYQCNVRSIVKRQSFDLMIAHPPCTYLSNSSVQHLYNADGTDNEQRWRDMADGVAFFKYLLELDIPKIAVENPIMHGHAKRLLGVKQTQIVQPYWFGEDESKATCLWLKNLPPLQPTDMIPPPYSTSIHRMSPSLQRAKLRSTTFQGMADAMAEQWGAWR
jgi:hypothetical protein